jgi:hypothetical protein
VLFAQLAGLLFGFGAGTGRILVSAERRRHQRDFPLGLPPRWLGGGDINGSVPQRVVNGTHPMQVDLTATKSSGIFPAGNYQGTVTVRYE